MRFEVFEQSGSTCVQPGEMIVAKIIEVSDKYFFSGCLLKIIPDFAEWFRDEIKEVLKEEFNGHDENVTEENLQSRIRGMYLMAISNKKNYMLLTTGNKSEMGVGYATLYGDMNGALGVIADVYKTDVYYVYNCSCSFDFPS